MVEVAISDEIAIGDNHPLVFIGGPCVLESEELAVEVAGQVSEICKRVGLPYIFKSSFDKANRTSIRSFRGQPIDEGLRILHRVKQEFGVPILTDIHEANQAATVAEVADVLQIPAFLVRQTDLLLAAADTGRVVNLKKGQFLAPWDMRHAVQKLEAGGTSRILLTERGTSFGYNNLIVDFRSLPQMRDLGYPVVFDAGHSVQMPGGLGEASGGESRYISILARASAAVGIDALFLEVHPDPEQALSDGPNMLPITRLEELLVQVRQIQKVVRLKDDPTSLLRDD